MSNSIEQAIGREIRRRRESAGVGQSRLATAARLYGLPWTRAMIAAIELGRRRLTLGELALMPLILAEADVTGGIVLTLSDLIPANDERPVETGPRLQMPLRIARALLLDGGEELRSVPKVVYRDADRRALEAAGDSEQRAAPALGVSPEAVVDAAHRRWGRSLTAERDRRVAAYTKPMLTHDPNEALSLEWPRRLQAIRGHVTRELLDELRPDVTTTKRGKKSTKGRAKR